MAINFPDAPVPGQIFQSYVWDGEKWLGASSAAAGSVVGAVRYDAAQALTSAQGAQARANVAVTKKNYIINGGMMISQENGLNSGSIANTVYYPADCFFGYSNSTASVVTQQQLGSVFPNSPGQIYVTNTTADASVAAGELAYVAQNLEGTRIADLKFGTASAKTITIQFTVAAPAGTYSLVICNGAVNNRAYVAEYVIAAGEANAYVVKAVTIPGDTAGTWNVDNTSAMRVTWGLMAGTTYQQTAGSWGGGANITGSPNQFNFMGTINNLFILSNVSLTEGNVAPPFQLPDYASELALCMRYWEKIHPDINVFSGNVTSGNGFYKATIFAVPKRATPTITGTHNSALGFPAAFGTSFANPNGVQEVRVANALQNGAFFSSIIVASARL